MFRIPPAERVDPAEEKRRVRENVIQNIATFILLCAFIRIAPLVAARL